MKKVLMVNNYGGYQRPFVQFGEITHNVELMVKNPKKIALIVFTGGEDISPELYGEKRHVKTATNGMRDLYEQKLFEFAVSNKIPIAGICRGAQLICALSGGKLVQHITNHMSAHSVKTIDGRKIRVTSSHHQMQLPPDGAIDIAWADPALSDVYAGPRGKQYEPDREHDVVFYPQSNALGMQYHPEYMNEVSDGFKLCGACIEEYLNVKPVVEQEIHS